MRIAEVFASLRKSGSSNTMVTSDLWAEVEILPFRACAMHLAIIIGTVRLMWTWLWGRYHVPVPQNAFLVSTVSETNKAIYQSESGGEFHMDIAQHGWTNLLRRLSSWTFICSYTVIQTNTTQQNRCHGMTNVLHYIYLFITWPLKRKSTHEK